MKAFFIDILDFLELKRLRGFTIALILLLITVFISFVALFLFVVTDKLDDTNSYVITATSEYYEYKPTPKTSASVLLWDYRLSETCDDFTGEFIRDYVKLEFGDKSLVTISRLGNSHIRFDIASESLTGVAENSALELSNVAAETEAETYLECLSVELRLSEVSPVFTLHVFGELILGNELNDAPDAYTPMLLSGEIVVEDEMMISKAAFYYSPINIGRGERVSVTDATDHHRGVLRASTEFEGIQSTTFIEGGVVELQMYRNEPKQLEFSIIDRLASDNEAAITFSTLIVTLQFFGAVIAFLMRLKVVNNTAKGNE